jgi:quinol-cytochrome oxidoreductase complex cytochrome b subunit
MEDNKILKLVYTFFTGVLIVIFIGVGISAFYPGPKYPEYPTTANFYGKSEPSEEEIAVQMQYDKDNKAYQDKMKPYSRNVSIITLTAAIILLVVSILFEKKLSMIADGVMLGGLFTLIYSIIRGFVSEDNKYVFLAVSIGLVVVLYLGYRKFVVPNSNVKNAVVKKSKS